MNTVSCLYNFVTLGLQHVCINVTLYMFFLVCLFTGGLRRCPSHLYQCGSGECVDPRLLCNGFINCIDGSDEGPGCAQHNCSSQSAPQCDQHCVSAPEGPVSTQLMGLCGTTLSFSVAVSLNNCISAFNIFQHALDKTALMFSSAEVLLCCRVQAALQRFVLCGH